MFNVPLVPPRASDFADDVDAIFYTLTALTFIFTVLVLTLLIFFVVRYRRGNKVDRSKPVHHDLRMELAWSIIPLILALGMFFWAAKPYASIYQPPASAREIFVIGKQWMWHLQHANGVRENNELHIPLGEPVRLTMISQDVIHNFFVPAFRAKRDVIPGRFTAMWFTPTQVGKYHLFCAEYCGTQHSRMIGWVYVMQPADFEKWLASGGSRGLENGQPTLTMAQAGQKLYEQLACGTCHDPDGMGRGPSLAGLYNTKVKTWDGQMITADDAYLRKSILEPREEVAAGYQQIMPSYKDQLNEDQILQILGYIKSLSPTAQTNQPSGGPKKPPESGKPAAGTPPGTPPAANTPPNGAAPAGATGTAPISAPSTRPSGTAPTPVTTQKDTNVGNQR